MDVFQMITTQAQMIISCFQSMLNCHTLTPVQERVCVCALCVCRPWGKAI